MNYYKLTHFRVYAHLSIVSRTSKMNAEIIPKFKVFVKMFFGFKSSESHKSPKWLKLSKIAVFYGQVSTWSRGSWVRGGVQSTRFAKGGITLQNEA